eukprot:3932188-Rhodomonas_salina.1
MPVASPRVSDDRAQLALDLVAQRRGPRQPLPLPHAHPRPGDTRTALRPALSLRTLSSPLSLLSLLSRSPSAPRLFFLSSLSCLSLSFSPLSLLSPCSSLSNAAVDASGSVVALRSRYGRASSLERGSARGALLTLRSNRHWSSRAPGRTLRSPTPPVTQARRAAAAAWAGLSRAPGARR